MGSVIEKESLTIVYSAMGWIRAMRGHIGLDSKLKFRDGDEENIIFQPLTRIVTMPQQIRGLLNAN